VTKRPAAASVSERLRRLRARKQVESYAVYAIAVQLPRNAVGSVFSRAHPELRIEILNRMELISDLLLLEARVISPGPGRWTEWQEEVRTIPGVSKVEFQIESPHAAIFRLILRTGLIWRVVQQHRVLARFPILIQQGWLRFETVATSSQIRPFLREAQRRVGPSRVESVRRHAVSLGSLGLTPSQDAVFREALRSGYFSVPRRISVSGLAAQLGRSKSSTSEMLSKIHQRLAESALQLDVAPLLART
jgi:hypothetical protein